MIRTGLVVLGAAVVLSGCVRASYESTPVEVNTSKGKVTCQLYTPGRVQWDEAIAKPESMSKKEADNICIEQGAKQLEAYRAAGGRV
ncbi:hypothetical protein [Aliiroseovarius sp. F47248L]|uniref:hypothetical protein n=1 Tax=Aliiroseovarius sp. F47248L TaxID=2926420 RepID=UPI001FF52559|nr:hypothetical protein [Aliiroseovarius sp. F47248L]MCK0139052.1 hypothetical protein [Aliiroseovarius sp. F47248L]